MIGGICYINLARMPWFVITLLNTLIYGACFGAVVVLHIRAVAILHTEINEGGSRQMNQHVVIGSIEAGASAAAGIVLTVMLVESGSEDFLWAMMVLAVELLIGGVSMAASRGWKTEFENLCWKFDIEIEYWGYSRDQVAATKCK
jgi:hypothetical protein